ncbi:ZYRO0B05742p [Zygosaccharomyces rouxii]|uniref:ZYRO0B05742p n=1 Tax=Zygosaccharomyces rouxii (strain ATCC 2623 / CBS 732 / NBRC 1130 / NCYC 568 / NRRL Y-229) TaxID=559307 RepID=C5DR58_ZYGRC|nr:uncharacterized protein ZYRO0B05742g [Zygosaccharomyces rouxii]KAH9200186.1 stress-activated map kinase interacting protein 1-domain-containing protein [Zygosaccharomyces rouxii]CAR26269.1 ZYRO0B05742p [Zygosaccharomyces rouxii]
MDTETSINRLRAQFLSECPDKDLMRRIIKPYCHGHDVLRPKDVNSNIRKFYITPEGIDIFPDLESPPMSRNYMDNCLSNSNKKPGKGSKSSSQPNEYNSDSEAEMENYNKDGGGGVKNVPEKAQGLGLHRGDTTMAPHNFSDDDGESTSKVGEPVPMPILSEAQGEEEEGREDENNIIETNDLDSDSDDSDSDDSDFSSESRDSKKKGNSNRKLSFPRIFKGSKKENADSSRKSSGKKKASVSSQTNKRHNSAFDMNFGYEHGFEDTDEDEDEDEDDSGADLPSQFFQLDRQASKNSNNNEIGESESQPHRPNSNNSLSYINNNNSNTNVGGRDSSKKKSHFPQNMIPRPTLLDGGRNSSRSERFLKGGNGASNGAGNGNGNGNGNNNGNNNNYNGNLNGNSNGVGVNEEYLGSPGVTSEGTKSDEQEEEISDIESYINEQDLDNLNLDATPPMNEKSLSSKNELDITDNKDVVTTDSLPEDENSFNYPDNSDLVSSYGKSLLDSDFSGDNVFKPVDSATESNSILEDSDLQPETVSHSIPLSLDEYGIYHGQDDTTLDTAFDKAVLNIKGLKPSNLKEKRQYGRPNSRSTSISRHSNSSNAKGKDTTNSFMGASGDSNKVLKHVDSRAQMHASVDSKAEKSATPASSAYNNKNPAKNDWLSVEKTTNFGKPKNHNSQLSSLFRKKINPSKSSKDLLEYFSFVSGSKVPQFESTELNVYIEASKSFKRTPFNLQVRKSANVFEVIGFILFHYATEVEEKNMKDDGLKLEELQNPNRFCLKIVDEDGAPFEDDFGKLSRKKVIETLSDDEVVLCRVGDAEMESNERETPVPFNGGGEVMNGTEVLKKDLSSGALNQLSYYKPILGQDDANDNNGGNSKTIEVKVYIYPNTNKKFNFTNINVSVTSSINDILVKYCKMKHMDPNEYIVKIPEKKLALNLNDTVLRLDGNYQVEIISKKDARELNLEKLKPDIKKPNLPTIQSNDLTPLTLEPGTEYLKPEKVNEKSERENQSSAHRTLSKKKLAAKHKLGLSTPNSSTSSNNSVPLGNGFFKLKNNSKTSLHGSLSYYAPNRPLLAGTGVAAGLTDNGYQDLFSGAYHRYRVWRRQQMSLINKHERTLALDGDYIYIVPPENYLHWHENVKTKSLHISQVILCKKSKRVPEYFKIFFRRGQDEIKRYYFEAVSPEECTEIVSRIQNLASAYKMNHK